MKAIIFGLILGVTSIVNVEADILVTQPIQQQNYSSIGSTCTHLWGDIQVIGTSFGLIDNREYPLLTGQIIDSKPKPDNRPKITLSMIMKNEANRYLRRVL